MPSIAITEQLHDAIIDLTDTAGIDLIYGKRNALGRYDIEVSSAFYNWLTSEMVPGETFTQAITRLLGAKGKGMRVAR